MVYPYIERVENRLTSVHTSLLISPSSSLSTLPPAPSSLLLPRSPSLTPSPSPSFLSYLFPASPNPLPPNRDVSRELSSFGKKEWQLPQREYICGGWLYQMKALGGIPCVYSHCYSDNDNNNHYHITSCVCLTKQCVISMCYVNC